jgi:hypothetical protein
MVGQLLQAAWECHGHGAHAYLFTSVPYHSTAEQAIGFAKASEKKCSAGVACPLTTAGSHTGLVWIPQHFRNLSVIFSQYFRIASETFLTYPQISSLPGNRQHLAEQSLAGLACKEKNHALYRIQHVFVSDGVSGRLWELGGYHGPRERRGAD